MAWSNRQKGIAHIYKAAAQLSDTDYRCMLREVSGAMSAKHPALTQGHFDQFMGRIETVLADRVHRGVIPKPASRKISSLRYWRNRLPAPGEMNSRQRHKIISEPSGDDPGGLWNRLQEFLPEEERTMRYLCGIASQACGYHVSDFWKLKAWQANLLVEALKDRLKYAVSNHEAA